MEIYMKNKQKWALVCLISIIALIGIVGCQSKKNKEKVPVEGTEISTAMEE